MTMRLIIPLQEFEEKCDMMALEGNQLFEKEVTDVQNAINSFHAEVENWDQKLQLFLHKAFEPDLASFHEQYIQAFQSKTTEWHQMPLLEIKNQINIKVQCILDIEEFVKMSDAIINPDDPEVLARKDFAITQKEEFLMKKLYAVHAKGKYYLVRDVFEYNGIAMHSWDEDVKICTPMKHTGDIETIEMPKGIGAKLSEGGMRFVEKFLFHARKEPAIVPAAVAEDKFNDILAELNAAGLVQEIVFDEIEDLKQLVNKLTPKQWKEVVLGKLVDLGLQQSIKNDLLKLIYKKLTNETVVFSI
ncbi:MAG: hypothetical protein ACKVOU_00585 [Cytophagales bacterium]